MRKSARRRQFELEPFLHGRNRWGGRFLIAGDRARTGNVQLGRLVLYH